MAATKAITKDVELYILSFDKNTLYHKGKDRLGNTFYIDLMCSDEFKDAQELVGKRILIRNAIPNTFIGVNMMIVGEGKFPKEKIEKREETNQEQLFDF